MNTSLRDTIARWNKTTDTFTKLQHGYGAITLLLLVAAGIIGLINYSLGQSLLFLSLLALLVFIANGVLWALLKTFVIGQISQPSATQKTRTRTK